MRVLIVDDHERVRRGVREVLARALEQAAFGEAGSAAEALRQVEQELWDVVLLDLSLPDRSGLDTLKELRRARPDLPVLVMSMHPEEQYGAAALAAGAAAYLAKGSDPEAIAAAVRRAVAAPAPGGMTATAELPSQEGLARLLHDDLAQALAAVKINLQLTRGADTAQVERRISESLVAVDGAIASVRRLAERLGSGR
jgi:two-component system invasion response regulator UvrY